MRAKAARKADRGPARGAAGAASGNELERGRALYRQRAWVESYRALSRADQASRLEAGDLFLLAMAAALLGRTDALLSALERAHHAYLESGDLQRAARMAFWLVIR